MDLHTRFSDALRAAVPEEAFRAELMALRKQGMTHEQLLDALNAFRRDLPEAEEDTVLDAMDTLAGWCGPSARIE